MVTSRSTFNPGVAGPVPGYFALFSAGSAHCRNTLKRRVSVVEPPLAHAAPQGDPADPEDLSGPLPVAAGALERCADALDVVGLLRGGGRRRVDGQRLHGVLTCARVHDLEGQIRQLQDGPVADHVGVL